MLYLAMIENGEVNFAVVIIAIVAIVLFLCAEVLQSKNILHMIQLSSYNLDQIKIWLRKNRRKFLLNRILLYITIIVVVAEIIFLFLTLNGGGIGTIIIAIYILPLLLEIIDIIFSLIILIKELISRKKKQKLSYTKRIIRNIFCNAILYIIFVSLILYSFVTLEYDDLMIWVESVVLSIFIIAAPSITYISYLIMLPIEKYLRKGFINKAKKKLLENKNLRIAGITGSFGKTSVKNFLYKILSTKYNVCISPKSYNVPMGACITINDYLKSYDEIFVQEMGARRVGDIKEMCDIVEPKDAIVTEVGEMHLDTFKTIENVLKTKMELVEDVVARWRKNNTIAGTDTNANVGTNDGTKDGANSNANDDINAGTNAGINDSANAGVNGGANAGVIVLNGDNQLIRDYVDKSSWSTDNNIMKNIYFVGENENNDFIIENIVGDKNGASFDLKINSNICERINKGNKLVNENDLINRSPEVESKIINFNTKLIGKNNILDISLAVTFALLKGISIDDIKNEVRKLEQVKARLEIMNIDENTIIINDGYNSNPVGAKNAIDAISTFDGYKKIIVTPGMVELGDKQYEENKKMASYATEKLDEVVVVGNANKEALMDGAGGNAKFFVSEEEAINYARAEQTKKIILLENDITDNY